MERVSTTIYLHAVSSIFKFCNPFPFLHSFHKCRTFSHAMRVHSACVSASFPHHVLEHKRSALRTLVSLATQQGRRITWKRILELSKNACLIPPSLFCPSLTFGPQAQFSRIRLNQRSFSCEPISEGGCAKMYLPDNASAGSNGSVRDQHNRARPAHKLPALWFGLPGRVSAGTLTV